MWYKNSYVQLWAWVTVSVSYDDNRYDTDASNPVVLFSWTSLTRIQHLLPLANNNKIKYLQDVQLVFIYLAVNELITDKT